MKIILKDGTEIQNAMVGKANAFIELTMSKQDAITNFGKFMDSSIMSEIEYYSGVWKTIFIGFDRLDHVDNPTEDEMRVWMVGGQNASVSDPIQLVDDMYMPKGV